LSGVYSKKQVYSIEEVNEMRKIMKKFVILLISVFVILTYTSNFAFGGSYETLKTDAEKLAEKKAKGLVRVGD
jgi:hypothetical protein